MQMSKLVMAKALLAGAVSVLGCTDQVASDEGTWVVDYRLDDGALLGVWGSSANDVWAAGGNRGRGVVLHFDGSTWSPVDVDAPAILNWIYGFAPDDVYAAGEDGLILHYDGFRWERAASATTSTLYGIWGATAEDVWIVGGDPTGSPGAAVVLRGQGQSFEVVTDVPAELLPGALYKIYGGPQSLVAVGSGGTVLRVEDGAWRREEAPTQEPLFSLWGRTADDVYAVGGAGAGELLHYDGGDWSKLVDAPLSEGLSGVFTSMDRPTIAVGASSYVVEVFPDGRVVEPELPALDPVPSLHGVWGDENGTTYAVGGDLLSYPGPMTGVIFRRP